MSHARWKICFHICMFSVCFTVWLKVLIGPLATEIVNSLKMCLWMLNYGMPLFTVFQFGSTGRYLWAQLNGTMLFWKLVSQIGRGDYARPESLTSDTAQIFLVCLTSLGGLSMEIKTKTLFFFLPLQCFLGKAGVFFFSISNWPGIASSCHQRETALVCKGGGEKVTLCVLSCHSWGKEKNQFYPHFLIMISHFVGLPPKEQWIVGGNPYRCHFGAVSSDCTWWEP